MLEECGMYQQIRTAPSILPLLCECLPVYDEVCRRSMNAFHIAPKSFDVLLITVFIMDVMTLLLAGMYYTVCTELELH